MWIKALEHKVCYRECDMMKVVNNAVYVHWMEDARVNALEKIGCDYKTIEEKGYAGPVLSLSVEYKNSAKFGDEVEIDIKFAKYTGVRLIIEYVIKQKGTDKVYATASSSHCFIDMKTGRPVLIRSIYPEWDTAIANASKDAPTD